MRPFWKARLVVSFTLSAASTNAIRLPYQFAELSASFSVNHAPPFGAAAIPHGPVFGCMIVFEATPSLTSPTT